MKSLLFLLDYYPPHRGGIENVFENIISRLLQKGYHIYLITSRFSHDLPTQQQHKNLTIYRVGTGRKSFFFAAFWMGVKVLWKYPHIHLIHSSTYTSAFPASVLGKLFHKKTILTVHEIFGKLWKLFKPWYIRWGYQLFERLCFLIPHNAYHCVSLYTLNSLRLYYGISDAKLHLIYNGVDTEFWNAHHVSEATKRQRRTTYGWENKFLMLYYGHSGKSKGIDYLVQALPALLQQHPDAVLIFNLIPAKRDKAIKATLRQQAQKSGHPEQIQIFDGREKEELRALVACVDMVIAPSLAEGFGSVHSEVCAMGKPLITTQVAAIPEVVSGHVKCVQPCSREAIIQAVEEMRNEIATQTGTRLPPKVFDWNMSVQRLEGLY